MDNANTHAIEEAPTMPDHASITPEAGFRPGPTPRNNRRWPILLGGIMLLLQGCATTPSPPPSDEARTQAKIAYLLSDYQRTLTIVLPRAEAGEPWAQYTLGYMYYYGNGVRQDRQTAKRWIESAAAKGYAPAQQAMQLISAPPPRTEEKGNAGTMQEPADATVTPPPAAEQVQPTRPKMTAPLQETNPPASSSEPSISPPPPPPLPAPSPETAPTPRNEPEQTPESPQSSADPPPPQTSASPGSATPTTQAPAAITQNPEIKGSDWIARQDPRHFTLQLASSLDKAAIIRLIHKQRIEQGAAYYSTRQNGRTWYSLVYGSYTNRNSAHQAMRNLPRSLRRNHPRIRSFGEIHSQLSPTS
jgi:septal ring-binding cell division protein DamX